jgi:hypothetical protein
MDRENGSIPASALLLQPVCFFGNQYEVTFALFCSILDHEDN